MTRRRVMSRRQPSLPGFPDIPEKLEVRIPTMPWKQIGGDMDPGTYGGTIATADGGHIELLKIQPVREYVGDKEAAEVGFPFWTREAYFDLSDLDPDDDDVKSALSYTGFTEGDQKIWFEDEATPEERALVIAESLLDYGRADEGPAGWSSDLPDYDVEWSGGTTAPLSKYLSDEDDAFKDDVLGYSDIRSALEEQVQTSADMSAAMAWSTVDDSTRDRLGRDGFDPDTVVGVAEFGDAVAIDGDPTDKTLASVEAELEADDYEETDRGGRIPTTEEHVSPEHIIRHVAKEMGLDEDVVADAAQGIDWWPKRGRDEIPWGAEGYGSVWAKKDPNAHVDDGDYIVQGAYADGTIVGGLGGGGGETFGLNDEEAAIRAAKKLLRDPMFEGDYVTVITRDGELVWDSRGGETEERRRPSRRRR